MISNSWIYEERVKFHAIIRFLFFFSNETALNCAVNKGNIDIVKLLLTSSDIDVNELNV